MTLIFIIKIFLNIKINNIYNIVFYSFIQNSTFIHSSLFIIAQKNIKNNGQISMSIFQSNR